MAEKLKENWFVVLIALIMIGFTGYFIYDQNKDNVTVKQVDGKDVIATLKDADITAEELYEQGEPFDKTILYNMYKNAVIDQSVKTTEELEKLAKNTQGLIIQNAKQQSDNYKEILTKELAGYGFADYDDLYEYALVNAKEGQLDKDYIKNHYDELQESVLAQNPRIISIISMKVADPNNLTDEEKKKQENIDQSIEKDGFAKAATAFSEDVETAPNEGVFGYVDKNSSNLDSAVVSAVTELENGKVTEWIQVTDSASGEVSLYKAHVDETDLKKIFDSENTDIQNALNDAFVQNNPSLRADAIEEAAKKLDIKFENDDVKKKLEEYIASLQNKEDGE